MIQKRINLWSSPRNISTAFMYSFAQRQDTSVVDEPFYAYYLSHCERELDHPGRAEVLKSQPSNFDEVVRTTILGAYPTPLVVFKQMTHHMLEGNYDFAEGMYNVMLIRNPRDIIHSYAKVIHTPVMGDIGVEQQLDIFEKLNQMGSLHAVVDTHELLKNSPAVLTELCANLDIPYDPAMLTWPAGPRPEDGVWAPYWYKNVHKSTGFATPPTEEKVIPESLHPLLESCMPIYDILFESAIKS